MKMMYLFLPLGFKLLIIWYWKIHHSYYFKLLEQAVILAWYWPSGLSKLKISPTALPSNGGFLVVFVYIEISRRQGHILILAWLFLAESWLVQYNRYTILLFIFQVSVFFTESPTNPFLRCVDIELVSKLCHSKGAIVCIDGTFASPVNQKALTFGADLVLHSATKFIAGHNDVSEVQLNYYKFFIGCSFVFLI